jgi:glycosyltransferase involved in cell wall biosynthesis
MDRPPLKSKKKLAVYTLTRDRLDYTKRMLEQLKNCGEEFDHYILDNGSTDGTAEWLKDAIKLPQNTGLWTAINILLVYTNHFRDYRYVLKLDNDLEFPEDGWLTKLIDTYEARDYDILTPFVEGICKGKGGPDRIMNDNGIGMTLSVGGACLLTTAESYNDLFPNRYMARGWDTWFCSSKKCGVVEDIKVKHDTVKQEAEKPEYYKRKQEESKLVYGYEDRDMYVQL